MSTASIKIAIQKIEELVNDKSMLLLRKELIDLPISEYSPKDRLTVVNQLAYINFLNEATRDLRKSNSAESILEAIKDYEILVSSRCEDLAILYQDSLKSNSVFYNLTSANIKLVSTYCYLIRNNLDHIFKEATKLKNEEDIKTKVLADSIVKTTNKNLNEYGIKLSNNLISLKNKINTVKAEEPSFDLDKSFSIINNQRQNIINNIANSFNYINSFLPEVTKILPKIDLSLIKSANASASLTTTVVSSQNTPTLTPKVASSDLESLEKNLKNVKVEELRNLDFNNLTKIINEISKKEFSNAVKSSAILIASPTLNTKAKEELLKAIGGIDDIVQKLSKLNSEVIKENTTVASPVTRETKVDDPITYSPNPLLPVNTNEDLTPDKWGVKFSITETPTTEDIRFLTEAPVTNFYMTLLPARQSTLPVQGGRDTPNSMPGLNFKETPASIKHKIPGFQPIFQNMGISGMMITMVGCFTGADGAVNQTDQVNLGKDQFAKKGIDTLWDNPSPLLTQVDKVLSDLNSYNSYLEFTQMMRRGKRIEVEINLLKAYKGNFTPSALANMSKMQSSNGNPKFTTIIKALDVYHATKDRTWYTLTLEVTDFGRASASSINLNNRLEEQIRKAQEELEKTQTEIKAKAENPTSSLLDETRDNISKLPLEDRKKYLTMLNFAASVVDDARKNNIINAERISQIREGLDKQESSFFNSLPSFSYIQYIPLRNKEKGGLLKIAINCEGFTGYRKTDYTPLLFKVIADIFNPLVDLANETTNRDKFKCEYSVYFLLNQTDIIKELPGNDGEYVGPHRFDASLASDGKFWRDKLHGTKEERNSLLNDKRNKITLQEGFLALGSAVGCVGATAAGGAIAGSIVPVAGNAVGGLAGLALGAVQCLPAITGSLETSYYEENNGDEETNMSRWGEVAGDFIKQTATAAAFGIAGNAVSVKLGGNSVRAAIKQGNAFRTGQNIVNRARGFTPGTPFNPNTTLTAQLQTLPNLNVLNGKQIAVNGVPGVVTKVEGNTIFYNINNSGVIKTASVTEISEVPASVLKIFQPVVPVSSSAPVVKGTTFKANVAGQVQEVTLVGPLQNTTSVIVKYPNGTTGVLPISEIQEEAIRLSLTNSKSVVTPTSTPQSSNVSVASSSTNPTPTPPPPVSSVVRKPLSARIGELPDPINSLKGQVVTIKSANTTVDIVVTRVSSNGGRPPVYRVHGTKVGTNNATYSNSFDNVIDYPESIFTQPVITPVQSTSVNSPNPSLPQTPTSSPPPQTPVSVNISKVRKQALASVQNRLKRSASIPNVKYQIKLSNGNIVDFDNLNIEFKQGREVLVIAGELSDIPIKGPISVDKINVLVDNKIVEVIRTPLSFLE